MRSLSGEPLNLESEATSKKNTSGEQREGKILSTPESRDKWIKMRLEEKGM